jgi:23S rRNA (adenine2030-N6)-methyltransferase
VLSYRHAFHAGNLADVVKHVALVQILKALARKPAPFFVLDTHAGAGLYDLTIPPASTQREFVEGIGRVWQQAAGAPPGVDAYLAAVRGVQSADANAALHCYPGSPRFVRDALRENDRLVCCELHPADFAALRATSAGDSRIELRHEDGYSAIAATLPPRERRGLVLIDPAYERRDEPQRVQAGLSAGLQRFGHGIFLVWYPITRSVPIAPWHAALAASGARKVLRAELCVRPDDHPLGLNGSGLVIVNPPHRTREALAESLAWLLPRLAPDGGGRSRVDWLVAE